MEDKNLNEEILREQIRQEERSNSFRTGVTITISIVVSVVILFALYTVFVGGNSNGNSAIFSDEQLERLELAATLIDKNYLYEYDTDKMIDGAIDGMVSALDNKFTYYQDEEKYQESLTSGEDSYVGIGVHLTMDSDTGVIRVLGTMPNSPAEKSGILGGDLIIKVDELVINEKNYLEGVNAIRGEENTSVHLVIIRGNDQLEFDVTRSQIQENNVTSEIIDGIGYIRVFAFDNGIYKQFRAAYDELSAHGISGLIIDLRNNPGGYVDQTISIMDMFLPEADVLKLVDKNEKEKVYSTTNKENIDIPLAIIVNQNSASASEIMAAVMQDLDRAPVIGTTTFGKGVVQYVLKVPGHGAINCVAAQYFTPSKRVIQDNGIEPTFVVEVDEEYKNNTFIPRDKDTQLQRAIEYINTQK